MLLLRKSPSLTKSRNFHRFTTRNMSNTMKAVQFEKNGGPEVLKVVDLPKPVPKPGEILVRNSKAGVNFIDIYFRDGLYTGQLPMIPGREGSGTVEACGEGVDQFKPGDKVAFFGPNTYAQYSCPEAGYSIKLGDLSFDLGAAALLQGLTALTFVRSAYEVKPGDYVLVWAAAGGTGGLFCQLAKHFGATVIGCVGSEDKVQVAKSLGVNHVITYKTQDVVEEVKKITNGKGVQVVYDLVGKATFDLSIACLCNPHGTLVAVGNASGKVEPFDILRLSKGNYRLMRPTLFNYLQTHNDFANWSKELMELIDAGKLKISVHKSYPLDKSAEAQIDLGSGKTTGKLLIDCS